MRHILYILGGLLANLILVWIVAFIFFSIFPYDFMSMPPDTQLAVYQSGLYRRVIWIGFAVAYVYVSMACSGEDLMVVAFIVALYGSFNEISSATVGVAFLACVIPVIIASWKAASRDSENVRKATEQANQPAPAQPLYQPAPQPQQPARQPQPVRTADTEVVTVFHGAKREATIGRSSSCDITVSATNTSASRNHATISKDNGRYFYCDHSSNGSYINGIKVHNSTVEVHQGDRIEVAGGESISWSRINPRLDWLET